MVVGTGELSACTQAGAASKSFQQAADAAKVPFFLPGTGTAHQHLFGCQASGCTCRLVLLLGQLWRKKGPEVGVRKAFGGPQGRNPTGVGHRSWCSPPQSSQPLNLPGFVFPLFPISQLSKESKLSDQTPSRVDSIDYTQIHSTQTCGALRTGWMRLCQPQLLSAAAGEGSLAAIFNNINDNNSNNSNNNNSSLLVNPY